MLGKEWYLAQPLRDTATRVRLILARRGSGSAEPLGDLANDLGNLLNRTVSMINRYRAGQIPQPGPDTGLESGLKALTEDATQRSLRLMSAYEPQQALTAIWEIVTAANSYVEQSAPSTLSKSEKGGNESAGQQLDTVLFTLASTLGKLAW